MEILEDTEFTRLVRFGDDLEILLSHDDSYETVNVEKVDGNFRTRIGYFEFDQPGDCPGDYYRLCYMALEGCDGIYRRRGIGRAILQFFKDHTGAMLFCDPPDSPANDQATHIVDDGIPFVLKMKREGLIWFPEENPEQMH